MGRLKRRARQLSRRPARPARPSSFRYGRFVASRARFDGPSYQARLDALTREGKHLHGEADLVCSFSPRSVLDAGCGTGRVAIELARRGIEVVGVDREPTMLEEARKIAPELRFFEADLCDLAFDELFDIVVLVIRR